MMRQVRAIYENGHLRLLEPVSLIEGQEVAITITDNLLEDQLHAILGDLIQWRNPLDNRYAEIQARAEEIVRELSQGPSLVDIIIEDRGEY